MSATQPEPRQLADLLAGLPAEADERQLFPALRERVQRLGAQVIAIDDDPTGTQTVYDTPVLLDWTAAELERELAIERRLLFILTNSRSMPERAAAEANRKIGQAIARVEDMSGRRFSVISRSDSTLRGHYPLEVDALAGGLGGQFDGQLLIPSFFEGGRYTIGDTHWLTSGRSGEVIEAAASPFARDPVFGYSTSYLPAWVEEKSRGRWHASQVRSIDLETIRRGLEAVAAQLASCSGGAPVVVNAAGYGDLASFTIGLLDAEAGGKRFLYRTAASFVRLRAGLDSRPLLRPGDVIGEGGGVLVVVGSHVPMTTEQLAELLPAEQSGAGRTGFEVDVGAVLREEVEPRGLAQRIDDVLRADRGAVLFTSRKLHEASSDEESLANGQRVMQTLTDTVAGLQVRPRIVIGKGGITSHEVARSGLGASRATVLGQIIAGVPVWRLEHGSRLRFPGLPYVVFPGNVGDRGSLRQLVESFEA